MACRLSCQRCPGHELWIESSSELCRFTRKNAMLGNRRACVMVFRSGQELRDEAVEVVRTLDRHEVGRAVALDHFELGAPGILSATSRHSCTGVNRSCSPTMQRWVPSRLPGGPVHQIAGAPGPVDCRRAGRPGWDCSIASRRSAEPPPCCAGTRWRTAR
jgi:hypothetical protein